MAERRRLATTKRVSLADISEGWNDCYAIVTRASVETFLKVRDVEVADMSQAEQMQLELNIVRDHFVSGRINILADDSTRPELVDMTADDISESVEITNKLYLAILGVSLDPKDLPTVTEMSQTSEPTTQPLTSSNSTKTQ